jgi:acyl dehydratase
VKERQVTITREQIAAYAEASGDHNPIHMDDEFARSVGLPGVIAHGMLLMGLMASTVPEPRKLRQIAVRFGGIVVPGDMITFKAEPAGEGRLELSAVNQKGEAVLTKAAAEYSR